jgi:hypothetical protein
VKDTKITETGDTYTGKKVEPRFNNSLRLRVNVIDITQYRTYAL